jgi:23S rRNA (pseudouridine1915-N3)-methyltransferase
MIRIVCVGKIKQEWKPAQEEFIKRLRRFCKLELIEIKEEKAEMVKNYLQGFVIVLDERGKQMSSQEFAKLLDTKDLTFVIGGKEGVSDEVKQKADFILSLSKMTFSHQLARIILLEQIYRGFCIIHNLPYSR